MTIGERIKSLREEKGITQTELANAIGTTKQNIYKYENGIITNIPSDKIELIASFFGVSPCSIMGWKMINGIKSDEIKRLITARNILHRLENRGILENNLSTEQITAIRTAEYALDELCKSKDAQPVKHGRWIGIYEYCEKNGYIPSGMGIYYWCSECDKAEQKTSDFCPNCGARMDGEENG